MNRNPNPNSNRGRLKLKNLKNTNPNRTRQFRLMSATGVYETEDAAQVEAPAVVNIVVPSRMNSETSMGSRTNVAAVQIVTKSSVKSVNSERSMGALPTENRWDSFEQEPRPRPTRAECAPLREMHQPERAASRESSKHKTKTKPMLPPKSESRPKSKPAKPLEVDEQEDDEAEEYVEGEAEDNASGPEACPPCKFPQHDMQHLQRQLMKYRGEMERCGDAAKINGQLNEIFLRRLFDIERKADGDVDIMLVTYQEWVEMLLQINEVFINNMEDLESEVAERLEMMKRRLKSDCNNAENEVSKYRQDICSLLKLIQNAYHHDNWNMCGLQFQTLTPAEVLGLGQEQCAGSDRSMQGGYKYEQQPKRSVCPPPRLPLPCADLERQCSSHRCVIEPECELENVVFLPPCKQNPCADLNTEQSRCNDFDYSLKNSPSFDCTSSQCVCPAVAQPQQKSPCLDSGADQRNKLHVNANLRALAVEVAAKHDEICELKRQIGCLEDEIQKAQQKIQLKDNVIKELRSDLKCTNAKLSLKSAQTCPCSGVSYLKMPPINLEGQQSSRSASTQVSGGQDSCNQMQYLNDDCSQFDSLSHTGKLEQQKLRLLETELNELFEMAKDCKKQNLECHRKRLSDIFQKSEAEKAEAYRKLDFIRRQLIDLEATSCEPSKHKHNDSDSGFSSKCENDQDAKILNAVRKRLRRLNDTVFELKKCVQQLQIENNELSTCLDTEKSFSARNSETLKELADMLSSMTGKQFSYEDIYDGNSCQPNPFCESILQMKCDMEEKERQLRNVLAKRNKQIEELQESQEKQEEDSNELECSQKLENTSSHNNAITNISFTPSVFSQNTNTTPSNDTTFATAFSAQPTTTQQDKQQLLQTQTATQTSTETP